MTSGQPKKSKPRPDNIIEITTPSNGNSGNGIEKRLREVENSLVRLDTKFDTELKHLATKSWVLGGILGGMGVAATIALLFIKLFLFDPNPN